MAWIWGIAWSAAVATTHHPSTKPEATMGEIPIGAERDFVLREGGNGNGNGNGNGEANGNGSGEANVGGGNVGDSLQWTT